VQRNRRSNRTARWAVPILVAHAIGAGPATGQARDSGLAYFRAAAAHFDVPADEVVILADSALPAEEIPVALFVATRAGISPEALVALRSSGRSWTELAHRYGVGPAQLHVPFQNPPRSGTLASAYAQFGARSVGDWGGIELTPQDIVSLVNVRVLSGVLHLSPDEILRRRAGAESFVEVYRSVVGPGEVRGPVPCGGAPETRAAPPPARCGDFGRLRGVRA